MLLNCKEICTAFIICVNLMMFYRSVLPISNLVGSWHLFNSCMVNYKKTWHFFYLLGKIENTFKKLNFAKKILLWKKWGMYDRVFYLVLVVLYGGFRGPSIGLLRCRETLYVWSVLFFSDRKNFILSGDLLSFLPIFTSANYVNFMQIYLEVIDLVG